MTRESKKLAAFELPWPPSVNHYWGVRGRTRYVKEAGMRYRDDVIAAVWSVFDGRPPQWEHAIELVCDLQPPDDRRRDIDNIWKGVLDGLKHGGLMRDDCQVKKLVAEMHAKRPPGRVIVQVFEFFPRS